MGEGSVQLRHCPKRGSLSILSSLCDERVRQFSFLYSLNHLYPRTWIAVYIRLVSNRTGRVGRSAGYGGDNAFSSA